jgi:hypothetical protein
LRQPKREAFQDEGGRINQGARVGAMGRVSTVDVHAPIGHAHDQREAGAVGTKVSGGDGGVVAQGRGIRSPHHDSKRVGVDCAAVRRRFCATLAVSDGF